MLQPNVWTTFLINDTYEFYITPEHAHDSWSGAKLTIRNKHDHSETVSGIIPDSYLDETENLIMLPGLIEQTLVSYLRTR